MFLCLDIYCGMELVGYVLYEPVGFGQSGPMWRVVDEQGGTHALQLLGGTLPAQLDSRLRTLRKVSCPNLLKLHELRKLTDGRYVAIFEYLDGQDLEVLRAGREFSTPQVNFIALSLARGLAALHEVGLSHGDVSAANVMVTAQGRVVLVDLLGDVGMTRAFSTPETDELGGSGAAGESPHPAGTSSEGSGESLAARQAGDVYAMAQVLLALGMDAGLLKAALHPEGRSRPRAGELADAWENLPCCGIDLLSGAELMAARMRAAGRDVATELVSSSRHLRRPGSGQGQRREIRPPSPILRWGLPALMGAALALGAVLLPRLGNLPNTAQALPVQSTTPSTSLPAGDKVVSPGAGRKNSANAPHAADHTSAFPHDAPTPSERLADPAGPETASPVMSSTPAATPPTNLLPNSEGDQPHPPSLRDPITDDTSAQEILQQLLTKRDTALIRQDRAALEKLSVKDSIAGSADASLLAALRSSQAQIEGLSTAVKSATIVSGNKSNAGKNTRSVRLQVTLTQGAYTQIDRIGNHHQIAAIPDTESEILLSGNPWKIASVVRLN